MKIYRKIKAINTYTIKLEKEQMNKDAFYLPKFLVGLFPYNDNLPEHWNKILKKEFQENDEI